MRLEPIQQQKQAATSMEAWASLWQFLQELSNLSTQKQQLIKHLCGVIEPPGAGQSVDIWLLLVTGI